MRIAHAAAICRAIGCADTRAFCRAIGCADTRAFCRAIGCADTRAVAVRPHGPVGAAYARSAYGRRANAPDGDNVAELYFPIE